MKKTITILLVAMLVAALLVPSVFATDAAPQIIVESKDANAGDEIILAVSLANNPGITNGKVLVTFDENTFELVDILVGAEEEYENGYEANTTWRGLMEHKGPNVSFASTANSSRDHLMFEIVLNVKDTAVTGEYEIGIEVDYIKNNDEEDVAFEVVAGKVNVTGVEEEEEEHKHTLVHVEAVEPGCHYTGNVEYWYCTECDMVCTDEAMTQVTNHKSVIVPALGGEVVHVEAKEPTCYEDGNIEHWYCEKCEQVWQDEALTQLTNHMNVKLGVAHGEIVHMEAVAPGCHYEGLQEHWYCVECDTVWTDEAKTQISNHRNVIIPELGGDVVHVEAKEPTCFEDGNIEHWYCEECEQVWQDEALTQLTNHMNVKIGAAHGEIVHMEAVAPGCHYEGLQEHWYCVECNTVWTDEAQTQISNHNNVIIPEVGGEVKHVEAVAPTCTENGNIEYWYCEECEQVWQDEARTQLTNIKNVVDPALGHTYVNGVCTVCGEEDKNVPPTGDMSAIVFALVAVSGMGLVALTKKKED